MEYLNLQIWKRHVAKNIIASNSDLYKVFFIMPNGDMYLLEPYSIQKTLTLNNYAFRDYFQGAIKTNDIYVGNVIVSAAASADREAVIAVPVHSLKDNSTIVGVWGGSIDFGLARYCASKYAMLGFSESLYYELYGTGVRITVVSPIGVKTNFFNNQSFGNHKPNYTGFMLEPRAVSKAILAAANSPRLEIIVPFYVRAGVWFKHTLPYAVNPLVGALFRRQLNSTLNQ
jgi:NAD(P)-dependent dehydrogenase (short-subunit alcohol dehydrogenase family)